MASNEQHLPPDDLPDNATLSYKGRRRPAAPALATSDAPATYQAAPTADPGRVSAAPQPAEGYRLIRRVAVGGMGEIWEAVQESLGRLVAIKLIRRDRLRGQPGEAAVLSTEFRREAVFAARLEHPNIIPVHDLGRDDSGSPMLAMKYVQGTPWDRALARDFKELSAEQLLGKHLPVLIAVGQAVAFAHSRGVVHRDLKPAQVMLGEFGEVILIDWGLAVFVGEQQQLEQTRELGLPELEGKASACGPMSISLVGPFTIC